MHKVLCERGQEATGFRLSGGQEKRGACWGGLGHVVSPVDYMHCIVPLLWLLRYDRLRLLLLVLWFCCSGLTALNPSKARMTICLAASMVTVVSVVVES